MDIPIQTVTRRDYTGPIEVSVVGHPGITGQTVINATPPPADTQPKSKKAAAGAARVFEILDTILPVPKKGTKPTAKAIVSTEREFYDPIPECKLLVDLARRVSNTCNYGKRIQQVGIDAKSIWATDRAKRKKFYEKYEKEFLDEPQPLRTDLEFVLNKKDFIDVEIEPA